VKRLGGLAGVGGDVGEGRGRYVGRLGLVAWRGRWWFGVGRWGGSRGCSVFLCCVGVFGSLFCELRKMNNLSTTCAVAEEKKLTQDLVMLFIAGEPSSRASTVVDCDSGHTVTLSSPLCNGRHLRSLYLSKPSSHSKPSPNPHHYSPWPAYKHPLLISPHKLCKSFPSLPFPAHPSQNTENYLLTPSPQGDLCVAKLFPPRRENSKGSASDPGHASGSAARVVRCEASRNLKWSIANTGVISPIYKLSLPSPDSPDLPLFQISKPNPNAAFWSMFYFAYAGHNIPPKRIEFGKIQKNPPGPNGGGTRISITGKTPEEKAVWQTLGEGNEDCVEWVVLCAALNLLEYVFSCLSFYF